MAKQKGGEVAQQSRRITSSKDERNHNGMAIKRKKKKKNKIINRKDSDQSPSFLFFHFILFFLPVSILWSNLIHQTLFATFSTDYYNTDTNRWIFHLFIWQKRRKMAESSIFFGSVTVYVYICSGLRLSQASFAIDSE